MLQQHSATIVIVDYGTSNVHAVYRRIQQTGAQVCVSDKAGDVEKADKIILPGVGHFGRAIHNLEDLKLTEALNEAVLVKKKLILGICLGMQVMGDSSEEAADAQGLGWIKGSVRKLEVQDAARFKVPHMGWNGVESMRECPLTKGVAKDASFYFTHSYHFDVADKAVALQMTEYGKRFVSAIWQDNIFGVQYHPEKSHDSGMLLLKNFVKL